MHFEIIDEIRNIEIIAVGNSIKEIKRINKLYGNGRWRKLKGNCTIRFKEGKVYPVEIHWYEAHGIGRKEYKIKKIIFK